MADLPRHTAALRGTAVGNLRAPLRARTAAGNLRAPLRAQDEPDLYNSAALKKHALSVMQTVGKAVAALTSGLDAIVPVLRSLRMRHKGYGVLEAHYAVVGAALLATLQGGLGSAWNEVLAEAWAQTYSIVSQTMIAGAAY